MENTAPQSPERRSSAGTIAQNEINRLTVDAHMLAATLKSTSESLAEAQAKNVQLAAALKLVQGECGILMGKVAAWEARNLMVADIDSIASAATTDITRACFSGVPGPVLTARVRARVAEAMRAYSPTSAAA